MANSCVTFFDNLVLKHQALTFTLLAIHVVWLPKSTLGGSTGWHDRSCLVGLSHEENMQKMRILTLMQMAETMKEIDFETLQKELQVAPEDVESFIIDGECCSI